MRFLHLADLHIGKRLNEFSLIEYQKFIFDKKLRDSCHETVAIIAEIAF